MVETDNFALPPSLLNRFNGAIASPERLKNRSTEQTSTTFFLLLQYGKTLVKQTFSGHEPTNNKFYFLDVSKIISLGIETTRRGVWLDVYQ